MFWHSKKKKGRARQAEENKTKMTCDVLTGSTGCHTDPHTVALFAKGKKKKEKRARSCTTAVSSQVSVSKFAAYFSIFIL